MLKYHAQFLLDKEKNKATAKIRYRIKWNGNIVSFNIGYRVDISKWSTEVQRCKTNTTHGKKKIPFNVINKRIQKFQNACEDLFTSYELDNKIPDKETFKEDFNIKIGRVAEIKKEDKTFFELFDDFMQEEGIKNQWTNATTQKFKSIKNILFEFDEELSFEQLNEDKLIEYQYYLQDKLSYRNSTLLKHLSFVKWFLRWGAKRGFNSNNAFEYFKPKLRKTQKKIIFLSQEELHKVIDFQIPKQKKYLQGVKDVFLFLCFTGLRFSDAESLTKSDIKDNHIEVTTVKTADSLIIELNEHSKAISDKYKNIELTNNKALPTISNQKTNEYLKELMELAGIDELIRETYYIGNKRIEEVTPKYALISTHAGRRTFICNALALGIPPQVVMKWTGHSDYKSMKPYIDIADDIKANEMKKFNMILVPTIKIRD